MSIMNCPPARRVPESMGMSCHGNQGPAFGHRWRGSRHEGMGLGGARGRTSGVCLLPTGGGPFVWSAQTCLARLDYTSLGSHPWCKGACVQVGGHPGS